MKGRKIAIAIFHDDNGNIVFQERGSHSKAGEKYGFWGGGIESGESPKEALRREIREELGCFPKRLKYWRKFDFTVTEENQYKDWLMELYVFLSPITSELLSSGSSEGGGVVKMEIDKAIKSGGFYYADIQLLEKLKDYLHW